MSSKNIIQSLWIGSQLSAVEQLCIASFIHHGHEFHLYVYDEVAGVPKNVQLKDANQIIPKQDIFTAHDGSYAAFSDWFRWRMLYEKGCFWVDTDVVALKPFEFADDIIFGVNKFNIIQASVIRFPPQHKLSQLLANSCQNPHAFLPYDSNRQKIEKIIKKIRGDGRGDIDWGEKGGPVGFARALKYFELSSQAKPKTYFYPIFHRRWQDFFDETLTNYNDIDNMDLFSQTYGIHLWNEMMRQDPSFDKNALFPTKSLFEQLKRRYADEMELF